MRSEPSSEGWLYERCVGMRRCAVCERAANLAFYQGDKEYVYEFADEKTPDIWTQKLSSLIAA